jgi:TRAP-type transport system large permease protein
VLDAIVHVFREDCFCRYGVVAGVARIPMADLIKVSWPFMWAELIILFLMVLFPALVTVPAKWFSG